MAKSYNTDRKTREGTKIINNFGSVMTAIKYNNSKNVEIEFDSGFKTTNTWNMFIKKQIKSPYCKTVYGVGCLGEGIFTPNDKWYQMWRSMLCRTIYTNNKSANCYSDISVCEEWHNYQNFARWCKDNYYEVNDEKMNLDKDTLVKGNKIYSPDTCVFVPYRVNMIFVNNRGLRGDCPVGVSYDSSRDKFSAQCSTVDKYIHLGRYDSKNEAFYVYKTFKEKHMKEVAEEYKKYIPYTLYLAIINYTVEISD